MDGLKSGSIRTDRDIKRLGTIMSVWAHPDDETYCSGGIMAQAVRNIQTVICVTATKGELGSQNLKKWPLETLGDVRAKELKEALKALGIVKHHWLGYQDGRCNKVRPLDAITRLLALIELYKPDSILTFGPEGLTGHEDHKAVSRWVTETLEYVQNKPAVYHLVQAREPYEKFLKAADKKLNIFFNIDEPPLCEPGGCDISYELTPDILVRKRKALEAMPSQTASMLKVIPAGYLVKAFGTECYVRAR